MDWHWKNASRGYGNFGNSNQWTVNAGLESLARESAQNSCDARLPGEKARVDYTIIRLTGDDLRAFQSAVGWSSLKDHLEAMAGIEASVTSGQIRAGLVAAAQKDELLLLRIDDYGCRGLTGPEFAEDALPETDYGNFIKLCRLDLFSGKDAAAGGSFGLGKAVYWRFSRFQTAVFNSVLRREDAVDGDCRNRLFGVNQGTDHRLNEKRYEGRGCFGMLEADSEVSSRFADDALVEGLHLARADERPGTSALILGFYDPDEPEADAESLRAGLEAGLEQSFWPLLARGRVDLNVAVQDGDSHSSISVDPAKNFAELTAALHRFDEGRLDASLVAPLDVVARDVVIDVPRRKTAPQHGVLKHTAKLVVTLSDDQKDSLENRVCLFRKPEMVVETIYAAYPGVTYHAFLLAGVAVNPDLPTDEDRFADDFLRFAEPPAHDRWIPGGTKVSQVNLGAHYVAPWVASLRSIREQVEDQLRGLFGEPPPPPDKAPEAVARYLRFLAAGRGAAEGRVAKPRLAISSCSVEADGAWEVAVQAEMRNRTEGWSFTPHVVFVGLDGGHVKVDWDVDGVLAVDGCSVDDGRLVVPAAPKGRLLRASFIGRTEPASHPIPAQRSAIDVIAEDLSVGTVLS